MSARIAVVLKGYPRLSETFIAQELLGLERAGHHLALYSMRKPTDWTIHPVHAEIAAPVTYLPEYLYTEPIRVLRSVFKVWRRPAFRTALRVWLGDLRRNPTPNRVRRFGQAAVLAAELPADIRWLYAHFIHTPSAVTRYASLMTGLPWSCSAHAKDIWTSPDWELKANLGSARWAVTCSAIGREKLASLADTETKVRLLYHGLDLARFAQFDRPQSANDGRDSANPVRILAVGRAVEKKGFDVLLRALAQLPSDVHWRLAHIGGGELRQALKAEADARGLSDRIEWRGALEQRAVLDAYRSSDLFVLPCRIADDGDRDGLPNVLVEAQSQKLACLSTTVSAVPELIEHGRTGMLVAPEDADALARALAQLVTDPALRARLGAAGEARVRSSFDFRSGVASLSQQFRRSLDETAPAAALA